MTRKTKVVPIASGPQSLRLFFEKTTAMGGPALVEKQALGEQGAKHGPGKLGEDEDHRVKRTDPFDRRRGQGHGGVEVPPADRAEHDDHPEERQTLNEADDRKVRAELGLASRRDKQHDDTGDEKHQQKGADQLSKICG
jgi:hypothetical protein